MAPLKNPPGSLYGECPTVDFMRFSSSQSHIHTLVKVLKLNTFLCLVNGFCKDRERQTDRHSAVFQEEDAKLKGLEGEPRLLVPVTAHCFVGVWLTADRQLPWSAQGRGVGSKGAGPTRGC